MLKPPTYEDRNAILKLMKFETYAEYLESCLWDGIRRRAFAVKGRKCKLCRRGAVELHHVYYTLENLRGETLDGIYPLCRDCHVKVEFDGDTKVCLARAADKFYELLDSVPLLPKPTPNKQNGPPLCKCGQPRKRRGLLCKSCRREEVQQWRVAHKDKPKQAAPINLNKCRLCPNLARKDQPYCRRCKRKVVGGLIDPKKRKKSPKTAYVPHPASMYALMAERKRKRGA